MRLFYKIRTIIAFTLIFSVNTSYASNSLFFANSIDVDNLVEERINRTKKQENLDNLNLTPNQKKMWCMANFSKLANASDYVSTRVGLSLGTVTEANPIINNPGNLLQNLLIIKIITHIGIGLLNESNLTDEEKIVTNKIITTALGGVTINNLMVAAKVETTISILSGIIAGVVIYNNLDDWCSY